MSARADISPRGVLSAGIDIGHHDHPDDNGTSIGVNLDGELHVGMFLVGASIGYDDYAPLNGVTVHAGTYAARVGVDVPFAKTAPNRKGRTIQFDA
ncbi:MAG TPA: hypothetical protein VFV99_15975, partial [Kofleriaceae bacterium]|nr:hypothetical protein [Kofleriaceae bacterium]